MVVGTVKPHFFDALVLHNVVAEIAGEATAQLNSIMWENMAGTPGIL